MPRLLAAPERKQPVVLNEARPWACIRCGKPFGTEKAIEAMLGKLAGHAMFQGEALERLKMCSDCRVIDLLQRAGRTEDHAAMSQQLPATSALDEEIARAELYGLLARLWYAAPDAELLEAVQVAPTEAPAAGRLPGGAVAHRWWARHATPTRRRCATNTTRSSAASASPRSICSARTT